MHLTAAAVGGVKTLALGHHCGLHRQPGNGCSCSAGTAPGQTSPGSCPGRPQRPHEKQEEDGNESVAGEKLSNMARASFFSGMPVCMGPIVRPDKIHQPQVAPGHFPRKTAGNLRLRAGFYQYSIRAGPLAAKGPARGLSLGFLGIRSPRSRCQIVADELAQAVPTPAGSGSGPPGHRGGPPPPGRPPGPGSPPSGGVISPGGGPPACGSGDSRRPCR